MRVDQQGDFGVQFAKRGEGGERNLHQVADAAYIDEDLIRAFVGKASTKLANHRERVFSSAAGVSTRVAGRCWASNRGSARWQRFLFALSGKTRRGLLE